MTGARTSPPGEKPEASLATRLGNLCLTMMLIASLTGAAITGVLVWRAKERQLDMCWSILKVSDEAESSAQLRVVELEKQLDDAREHLRLLQEARTR
jgi:hypothetical protein